MTWCPNCKQFGVECSVDPEEYDEQCDSYTPKYVGITVTVIVALHSDDIKEVKEDRMDYRTAVGYAVNRGSFEIVDISNKET